MSLKYHKSSFINGCFVEINEQTFSVINPATMETLAKVSNDGVKGINLAIKAADKALNIWKKKTSSQRSEYLKKWYNLILSHQESIAQIMTLESGKPIKESLGEVSYGASFIEWFAEEGKRVNGDIISPHNSESRIHVIKQPIGVIGAITPWNFPLAMITRKIAPALAVGCTVIVRPSEETPLTALYLADLAKQAGFPPGVINIVVGLDASAMGKELCNSPIVKKISFTGSTKVGQILMRQSSNTLKKLSLELGGNAPFIVFNSANIDDAVNGAITSKYRNSGQTCVCTNRFYIQDDVFEEFIKKFLESVKKLKIGPGIESQNDIGPLINKRAIQKVQDFIKDAESKGAHVLLGNDQPAQFFFSPTILTGCNENMLISKEEVFGPVSAFFKFSAEDEVIEKANNTKYGLASYFYTQDLNQSIRVSENLEYGMVGVNTGLISTAVAPFGGIKFSGQGREGSKYGVDDYLEIKYICTGSVK